LFTLRASRRGTKMHGGVEILRIWGEDNSFLSQFLIGSPIAHTCIIRMITIHGNLLPIIHSRQVYDPLNGSHSTLLARSMAGMIRIYNELTQDIVSSSSVREFERRVHQFIKMKAAQGDTSWSTVLSTHGDGAWPTWRPSGRSRTVVWGSLLV